MLKKMMAGSVLVMLISGCAQDTYVRGADGTTYREIEKCDTIKNPKYGYTSTRDLAIGGLVGGAIGKKVSDGKKSGMAIGGVLGMIAASEPRLLYINCRKELRIIK